MNGILSILIICISEFLTAFFYLFVITVRLFARFISYALMIAAVFAFTADVTRWQIGDTKPLIYSLVQHANSISPNTLNEVTIIFKSYCILPVGTMLYSLWYQYQRGLFLYWWVMRLFLPVQNNGMLIYIRINWYYT